MTNNNKDYSKTKIYKIWSPLGDKIYIGSTTKEYLSQRMTTHRYTYNKYKKTNKEFITSFILFDEYGLENCIIELLEAKECNNINEAKQLEGGYIRNLECVNKNIAGRIYKEYYEDNKEVINTRHKEYYEDNKDVINTRHKEYYEDNKDVINIQQIKYRNNNEEKMKKHYENNKNENNIRAKQYYEDNKDKIKKYREANKERMKLYYETNKERINEQKRINKQLKKEQKMTNINNLI